MSLIIGRSGRGAPVMEVVMVLVWVIIVVLVLAALVGAALAVQARRRRGGVIVDPGAPSGRRPGDSS